MKLQFCFLNNLLFYFVPKSQEDYFFNYTDFVVNYDTLFFNSMNIIMYHTFFIFLGYKLHIFTKLNTNSCKIVIKEYPSNDIQKSCLI